MALETRPVSAALGVEILRLDLRTPFTDSVRDELRALLDRSHLLYFRGVNDLSAGDHVRIVSTFGPVADELDDGNQFSFVSNVDAVYFPQTRLLFHQDYSFTAAAPPVLSLYALETSGPPITTVFADNARPWRELPVADRALLADKQIVHVTDHSPAAKTMTAERRRTVLPLVAGATPRDHYPQTAHPLVQRNPRTGEEVLYVNEYFASHIEGVDVATSEAIIQRCFAALYDSANTYEHEWSVGDLMIWDNLALQHARGDVVPDARRTLRRVIVSERRINALYAESAGRADATVLG